MENEENLIGCSNGKVTVIDPNKGRPVPLEDLNISVQLRTYKRGRTVLRSNDEKGENIVQNKSAINLTFIEGSGDEGKRTLTTKYTDLTTSFEEGTINSETIGITGIDIDFNPSMAPLITINFIDVRGSSIFQNENSLNGANKYSTFFQLPYPIFELEIKGYYGRPVTYCLHMLKFNARFNSKTGNFEIQCQFIGYTYAMLSDMLMGHLAIIDKTPIGKEIYDGINSGRPADKQILTLHELLRAINNINNGVKKYSNNSEHAGDLNIIQKGLEALDDIKKRVNEISNYLNDGDIINSNSDNYIRKFAIRKNNYNENEVVEELNKYDTDIVGFIEDFNNLKVGGGITINETDFTNLRLSGEKRGWQSGIKFVLNGNSYTIEGVDKNSFTDDVAYAKYIDDVKRYVGNPNNIKNTNIDVYDFRYYIDKINMIDDLIRKKEKETKVKIANDLRGEFKNSLGFEPTVRSIVEIITTAIEVYMETIYRVSKSAEENKERTEELKNKFESTEKKDGFQIYDLNMKTVDTNKFYAWPNYSEYDAEKRSHVDKYLGDYGVLDNPHNVNELNFINHLMDAILKGYEDMQKIADDYLNESEGTWLPLNVFDTQIYQNTSPYKRMEFLNEGDLINYIRGRAYIFLKYTNNIETFSNESLETEIKPVAEYEADLLYNTLFEEGVSSQKLIKFLIEKGEKSFLETCYSTTNGWTYGIDESFPNNSCFYPIILNKETNGLTQTTIIERGVDGVVLPDENQITLVDIISKSEFDSKNLYIEGGEGLNLTSRINFSGINDEISKENVSSVGFNTTGGKYGIQEFSQLNDGNKLWLIFYKNTNGFYRGLSYNRENSFKIQKITEKRNKQTPYDLKQMNDNGEMVYSWVKVLEKNDKKEDTLFNGSVRNYYGLGENISLLSKTLSNEITGGEITYPLIEQIYYHKSEVGSNDKIFKKSFSLFGSKWYYLQDKTTPPVSDGGQITDFSRYIKSVLFLNSLPFARPEKGEVEQNNGLKFSLFGIPIKLFSSSSDDPLGNYHIKNLFDKRGGFIEAPKLWVTYIGSILWYLDDSKPKVDGGNIVGGGRGINDIFNWNLSEDDNGLKFQKMNMDGSKYKDFLPEVMATEAGGSYLYNAVNDSILNILPPQIKDEFKRYFFDFVNGDSSFSYETIRDNFEIWDGNSDDFCDVVNNIKNSVEKDVINGGIIGGSLKNVDNYEIITLNRRIGENTLFLELKSKPSSLLVNALKETVIIANKTFIPWNKTFNKVDENYERKNSDFENDYINVNTTTNDKPIFDYYLGTLYKKLKLNNNEYSPEERKRNIKQTVFGTDDDIVIKHLLYNTCKNIHDKWLAGVSETNDIMFKCGVVKAKSNSENEQESMGSSLDFGKRGARLIDSFNFVDRAFTDIGDDFYINPTPIMDILLSSGNLSAYNVIGSLMDNNNFTFNALPTFINYKERENLEDMFKPHPNYEEAVKEGHCGPSFVCVYTGQPSKHLDFVDSEYENDSFDLNCIDRTNVNPNIPSDFKNENTNISEGDDIKPLPVFMVRYGEQNQSIFKDIVLDQSEYTETDESLKIQDLISQGGAETNRTLTGQNIYNVYSVRSYNCEIDMMGNPMIQPMMYFQLDNIPMFHGAYMVKRVKHTIRPNTMETKVTGTRIRYSQTPLIDSNQLFMDLAGTLDVGNNDNSSNDSSSSRTQITSELLPIIRTIYENGGMAGDIARGNITTKPIPNIDRRIQIQNFNKNVLSEAVDAFVPMMQEWLAWMDNQGYKPDTSGYLLRVTDGFRTIADQERVRQNNPGQASKGISNHSWGIAIDIGYNTNSITTPLTERIPNKNSMENRKYFKFKDNPVIQWFYDNSYRFGFLIPKLLRDNAGTVDEYWHIEYHGKSAKCLLEEMPSTYGYTPKYDLPYHSSVKNPRTKDGQEAVYTDCKAVKPIYEPQSDGVDGDGIRSDSADYWTLVAICSLEGGSPQSRCDVAQSIFNRFRTPNQPYGKTIKDIILQQKQYEPVFRNINDWKKINDKETAIKALLGVEVLRDGKVVKMVKNKEQAEKFINETANALKNEELRNNSLNFVGTRTEFLGHPPNMSHTPTPDGVVQRNGGRINYIDNFYFWKYANKSLMGKSPIKKPPIDLA